MPIEVFEAQAVDSAAPTPDGHPPDQVREMHGLPISQAAFGPRSVGSHIAIGDQPVESLEGREVKGMPGLKISRTGTGMVDGFASSAHSTNAKIDQDPAGLPSGNTNRAA